MLADLDLQFTSIPWIEIRKTCKSVSPEIAALLVAIAYMFLLVDTKPSAAISPNNCQGRESAEPGAWGEAERARQSRNQQSSRPLTLHRLSTQIRTDPSSTKRTSCSSTSPRSLTNSLKSTPPSVRSRLSFEPLETVKESPEESLYEQEQPSLRSTALKWAMPPTDARANNKNEDKACASSSFGHVHYADDEDQTSCDPESSSRRPVRPRSRQEADEDLATLHSIGEDNRPTSSTRLEDFLRENGLPLHAGPSNSTGLMNLHQKPRKKYKGKGKGRASPPRIPPLAELEETEEPSRGRSLFRRIKDAPRSSTFCKIDRNGRRHRKSVADIELKREGLFERIKNRIKRKARQEDGEESSKSE